MSREHRDDGTVQLGLTIGLLYTYHMALRVIALLSAPMHELIQRGRQKCYHPQSHVISVLLY